MAPRTIAHLTLGGRSCAIVLQPQPARTLDPLGDRPIDAIIADSTTAALLPAKLSAPRVILPAGETGKQAPHLVTALEWLAERGIARDGIILGFGGGALTDTAAFAASTWLRGVRFVLVPTTLLAMVDAAIGGKTAIDLAGYKNVVGTFMPADEVRICPALLETLPEREYRSGLAEIIKAGLLGDAALVELLEARRDAVLSRDAEVVTELVERSVAVKVAVVAADFREGGVRAHLNLGHTFAHALESCLGLGEWSHGAAVAWGIVRAMALGRRTGLTEPGWAERVERLIRSYGYEVDARPVAADRLVAAMQMDKKRTREGLRFILQRGPQDTTITHVGRSELHAIL